jgi:WD40 repeat protein
MAEVYQAYHPVLERYVAIKVMRPHIAGQADSLQRFQHEAAAVARLRHPNIVQVYDFDVEHNLHYMVMEFVAGSTLSDEIKARHHQGQDFSPHEIYHIFHALAGAVGYAHQRGIVHRDLKPANVLFTADHHVMLADFGIAQMMGGEHSGSAIITGTPLYMSPEQGQGLAVDGRTDIYALGVMLYEMLAGRVPFHDTSGWMVIQKHVTEPVPLISTTRPDLPAAFDHIICTAMHKEPDNRYQTAADFLYALQDAAGITDEQEVATLHLATRPATTTSASGGHAAPSPTEVLAPCPYRGLFAFSEADAPFFFGREVMIDRLVDALEQRPITAIIGPSGSGKSSVVFAGLLPHLRQGAALQQAQGRAWTIVDMRPGSHPMQRLAAVFLPLLAPSHPQHTAPVAHPVPLTQQLHDEPFDLRQVVEQVVAQHPHHGRVLLVLDQFEEVYTLCTDPAAHREFLDQLLRATVHDAAQPPPPLHIVLTLRADFLGQALSYRPFADVLQDAAEILGPMTPQELAQAIENPAHKAGVRFEYGLVERILDDIGDEPGALPLLEFALTLLWDWQSSTGLSHAGYEEIGRVEGALARYAEHVYHDLGSDEQTRTQQVLVQCVAPGETTADTRRTATRAELGEAGWQLATRLADARLLVTGRNADGTETAEIVHEALIHHWARLHAWVEADRAFRTWQERIRAAIRQWQASGQDEGALVRGVALSEAEAWLEQRENDLSNDEKEYIRASLALHQREQQSRERARRRITIAAIATAVVLAVLLVAAVRSWSLARHESQQRQAAQLAAEARRSEAEQQARIATARYLASEALVALESAPQRSLLLAVESIRATQDVDGSRVADAEETLRTILAATGGTPLPTPATQGWVSETAASPDGRWLAAAGADGIVSVWDMRPGDEREPRHYPLRHYATAENLSANEDTPVREDILHLQFTPDSQELLVASSNLSLLAWNTTTHTTSTIALSSPPATLTDGEVADITISNDGHTLAMAASGDTVALWDVRTPTQEPRLMHGANPHLSQVRFSPDGRWMVSGGQDQTLRLWDMQRTHPTTPTLMRGHTAAISSFTFSPDSRYLAAGSSSGHVRLWDLRTPGAEPLLLTGHTLDVQAVTFSPDGAWFASSGTDAAIRLWSTDTLTGSGTLMRGHRGIVNHLVFSPDGQRLASGGWDGTIRLWNLDNPEGEPAVLRAHEHNIGSLRFVPASEDTAIGQYTWLISSGDGVRRWNVANPTADPTRLDSPVGSITDMALSRDGHWLAVAAGNNTAIVWETTTPTRTISIEPRLFQRSSDAGETPAPISLVELSDDGRWLAAADVASADITLWDLHAPYPSSSSSMKPLVLRGEATALVRDMVFQPGTHDLIVSGLDRIVRRWSFTDPTSAAPVVLPTQSDILGEFPTEVAPGALAISADSAWLAVGGSDGIIRMWPMTMTMTVTNPARDTAPQLAGGFELDIRAVAFSPDGQWMAASSNDGTTMLWDMQQFDTASLPSDPSQVVMGTMIQEGDLISSFGTLAFSPDGQWVIVPGAESSVRMLSPHARSEAAAVTLRGHTAVVNGVQYSPDGQWFATASFDGTVRIWIAPELLVHRACTTAGRNLTATEWAMFLGEHPHRPTCPLVER